jgi:hypothetical protein
VLASLRSSSDCSRKRPLNDAPTRVYVHGRRSMGSSKRECLQVKAAKTETEELQLVLLGYFQCFWCTLYKDRYPTAVSFFYCANPRSFRPWGRMSHLRWIAVVFSQLMFPHASLCIPSFHSVIGYKAAEVLKSSATRASYLHTWNVTTPVCPLDSLHGSVCFISNGMLNTHFLSHSEFTKGRVKFHNHSFKIITN